MIYFKDGIIFLFGKSLLYKTAVVDSGNESLDRSIDDIGVDTCAPEYAVFGLNADISASLRA